MARARAPFTEADWTDPEGPLTTPYYRSKTLAERAAWAFARDAGLALSVINPGLVLGPLIGRDYGTSVGLVAKAMRGVYPAVPNLSLPVVDVRDVASAHVLALQQPAAIGERFIAATDTLSFHEIMTVLRKSCPSHAGKLPRFVLPDLITRLVEKFDRTLTPIVRELSRDTRVPQREGAACAGLVAALGRGGDCRFRPEPDCSGTCLSCSVRRLPSASVRREAARHPGIAVFQRVHRRRHHALQLFAARQHAGDEVERAARQAGGRRRFPVQRRRGRGDLAAGRRRGDALGLRQAGCRRQSGALRQRLGLRCAGGLSCILSSCPAASAFFSASASCAMEALLVPGVSQTATMTG